MSIPVDVADLAVALAERGAGYLLTTRDGEIKVVTVDPRTEGDGIVVDGPGRGSTANLVDNPRCTLVLPPAEHHGYTLLVDGSAVVAGDRVTMTPESAVLHRPAGHADGPPPPSGVGTECGNDCHPVRTP